MKFTTCSESEFIQQFSLWLNPSKPTVVLCRNVIDIMRLRVYFHEKIYALGHSPTDGLSKTPDKTFFNISFLTVDQWIRKILPFHEFSEKLIHSPLAEKALVFQEIDQWIQKSNTGNQSSSLLAELLLLPHFNHEILYLWHLYSWTRQIQSRDFSKKFENSISVELFSLFNNVYENIRQQGFCLAPEIYSDAFSTGTPDPGKNKNLTDISGIYQVICMFPTDFNAIEKIKMNFLISSNPCLWRIILNNDGFADNSGGVLSSLHGLSESTEVYSLQYEEKTIPAYTDWQQGNKKNFSVNKGSFELKVRMCKDIHDEYLFIAQSIRRLYDKGIPLHRLFVLYCTPSELPLLDYYLHKYGLRLNYPEKFSGATRSLVSIATDLINFLSLRKISNQKNSSLTRNQIIELFFNPAFHISGLCDSQQSREIFAQIFFENFDLVSTFNLDSLQTRPLFLKNSQHSARLLTDLLRHFDREKKILVNSCLPSKHSEIFLNTLKKYLLKSSPAEDQFDIQFDAIEKTAQKFAMLDRYFPGGMTADFYYALLYDELSGIKLKYNPLSAMADVPEVYARNIQEGVHSPVDYLFVCNLTSKAFPLPDRHPDFLEADGVDINFSLNLDANAQKTKMRDSLRLVDKGYCMTFNLQQDSVPSEFIFEQIPSTEGEIKKRETMMMDLPFISRTADESFFNETGKNIEEKSSEISQSMIWQMPLDSKNLKSSFLAKFSGKEQKETREYTGQASPVSKEKVSSAGTIENFSWCPQLFWFQKIQKLSPVADYYEERNLDKSQTGTLFHASARNLIKYIIKNFPQTEYGKLNSCFSQKEMNAQISESFHLAREDLLVHLKTDFNVLAENALEKSLQQFRDYFLRFFYYAQHEKHPLYNYYPLETEFSFENISFGPFIFKGRIDRIDYLPANRQICVVDYKTGSSVKTSLELPDIKTLQKFQLPLYIKAVCDIVNRKNHAWAEPVEYIEGAYEFTSDNKKIVTRFLKLHEDVQSKERPVYSIKTITGELEMILKERFDLLQETLSSGYFFAHGHKKKIDSDWESGCKYCDYDIICDRSPYAVMIERLNADPLAKKYLSEN